MNIVEVINILQQEVLLWHTGSVRKSSGFQGGLELKGTFKSASSQKPEPVS